MDWYVTNRRALPWRKTKDPYKVWLSEVILQQTRVEQGLPYYLRFVSAFPDILSLAKAREQTVLRLWQGLGYYSRARNLHRCAKLIAGKFGGIFPSARDELLALPGVGPYTAAAISSIAFSQQTAAVDGNVFRVLSRIYGIESDTATATGRHAFQQKAAELVPEEEPGDFNQALMEFGATHCTPRKPDCENCPFRENCTARRQGTVHLLPRKGQKPTVRTRHLTYIVFLSEGKVGLRKRVDRDIWRGLFDFYLVETRRSMAGQKLIDGHRQLKALDLKVTGELKLRHTLTHRLLEIKFLTVPLRKKNLTKVVERIGRIKFYSQHQARKLPKPVPVITYLDSLGILE